MPDTNKILETLSNLALQADADCPGEYRSDHFRHALDAAFQLLGDDIWLTN